MIIGDCGYCKKDIEKGYCPIFNLECASCRVRYLLSEPCKILRQYMAENMARKYEVPDWKIEPHCGCINRCKRHTQNTENRYKVIF